MVKIDTKVMVKNLDGSPADYDMGTALGVICVNANMGGRQKMTELAFLFKRATGIVEISDTDLAVVKTATEKSTVYDSSGNLVPGQVMIFLDECRNAGSIKSDVVMNSKPEDDPFAEESAPLPPKGSKKK